MIFYGESMGFILDPCYKLKAFAASVYRQLYIVKIKTSCSVIVVLDHTAYWDIDTKLFKDLEAYIDLTSSTIHEDQIRESGKASILGIYISKLHVLPFFKAVKKPSCKDFMHAGIIIRAFYRLDPELSVVALFGLTLFEYDHRSNIGKAAYIRYIISFHSDKILHAQDLLYLFDSAYSPSFFALYPLPVFG